MSTKNTPYVEHVINGPVVIVTILTEQIRDPDVVNRLKDALIGVIGGSSCKNVIMDMRRVKFIGSVGFLAFLAVRRLAGLENVVLCNLSENIRQLFVACRLIPNEKISNTPFQVATSVESALEWCRSVSA